MTTSLYDLTPGTRVVVTNSGHLSGQTGVVVEMATGLLNGHDCCVELDYETSDFIHEPWPGQLCFYARELTVAK